MDPSASLCDLVWCDVPFLLGTLNGKLYFHCHSSPDLLASLHLNNNKPSLKTHTQELLPSGPLHSLCVSGFTYLHIYSCLCWCLTSGPPSSSSPELYFSVDKYVFFFESWNLPVNLEVLSIACQTVALDLHAWDPWFQLLHTHR